MALAKLRAELEDLLAKMDQEGLRFLIRQARTIVHNLEVDRANDEIQRLGKQSTALDEQDAKTAPPTGSTAVAIEESAGGKSFVMAIGGKRKVFSLEEMRGLARICHDAANKGDGSARLYNWFKRNRSDLFYDVGIADSRHPVLGLIYSEIRRRYKPKQA